MTVA
jgi:hypothetical protein